MIANPNSSLRRTDVARITQISMTTAKRVLDDLVELKAIVLAELKDKSQGRPIQTWSVSADIKSLIKLARLTDTQHIKMLLHEFSKKQKEKGVTR